MHETSDSAHESDQPQSTGKEGMLGDAGLAAIHGNSESADTLLDIKRRTARDGIDAHVAYGRTVADVLDDPEAGVDVQIEEQVRLPDGRTGRIDTRIGDIIVGYKTNDMKRWSRKDAIQYSNLHGAKLRAYANSKDTPASSRAYLIAAGREPDDAHIFEAYRERLQNAYAVEYRYARGGDPEDVLREINAIRAQQENE